MGFSYVVGYWHGFEGQRILYCRVVNLMYINELWLYNCGDYMNALKIVCGINDVLLLHVVVI